MRIPKKEIEVYSLKLLDFRSLNALEFEQTVFDQIPKVNGEFRQKEILERWREFFKKNKVLQFSLTTFKISCSSGTYVRSIAHEFGKKLAIPALTYSIKRTKIGDFTLQSPLLQDLS